MVSDRWTLIDRASYGLHSRKGKIGLVKRIRTSTRKRSLVSLLAMWFGT